MKLNPDCIRDILIAVEAETDAFSGFCYEQADPGHSGLSKYEHNEIVYHINQCDMAGLIVSVQIMDAGETIWIGDLSPDGHKFLANIREDTIWNGAKNVAAQIGARSLDALLQIASSIVTELIRSHFGLT